MSNKKTDQKKAAAVLKARVAVKAAKKAKSLNVGLTRPAKRPPHSNVPQRSLQRSDGYAAMMAAGYQRALANREVPAKTHIYADYPASPAEMAGRYGTSKTSAYAASAPTQFRTTQLQSTPKKAAKIALGDPNKVGANINRIRQPKNLHSAPHGQNEVNKVERLLSKMMDPNELLSPDAKRYCELLQKPLTAEWGDEGEQQVKPILYDGIVPPTSTQTVRAFGQLTISSGALATSTVPAQAVWICLAAGAGNIQRAPFQPTEASVGSDTIQYSHPLVSNSGGLVNSLCYTLGAPPDGRVGVGAAVAGGLPVAGYWYSDSNIQAPPSVDLTNGGKIETALVNSNGAGSKFSSNYLLTWGSPVPFGDMFSDDSAIYKYRPVAFGVQVTPVDIELEVGGAFNVSIIPQATNDPYVGTPTVGGNGDGFSVSVNDFYALPDHKIERADGTLTAAWLPSRMDYSFLQTHSLQSTAGTFGTSPGLTTSAANVRFFIQIVPPADGKVHVYTVTYVGFYEVAGTCVEETGIVPRPQPSLGAKVATTVQNALYNEIDDRPTSITKGAAFEVAKDHPKIGPMIEESKTPEDAKSVFSEVLSFGKELLPFAALLL